MSNNIYSRRSRDVKPQQNNGAINYSGINQNPNSNPSGNTATADSLANASSVIYLGNIPNDWNQEILSSVVAGSGKIVDIRSRIDPQGRNRNFCFVEYLNPQEATKALYLLNEVKLGPKKKLRVELSKEGLRASGSRDRPILELNRNFIPYYVQIPAGMRDNSVEASSQTNTPIQGNASMASIPSASSLNTSSTSQVQMPEVLAKASQYLPPFNPQAFTSQDKISQNLKGIPPVQLIELLSTLKQLISTNLSSAQQVFNMSPDIPVTVVQAMILLGLIDINTLTTAVQQQVQSTPQPNNNVTLNAPPPPAPVQRNSPQPDPRWPNLPAHTGAKLAKLDPNEAGMIAQVLGLSQNDINVLPPQQRQMVDSIRSQYL